MNRKHGHGGTHPSAEYISWRAMRQRCLYPKHRAFKNYGGRGIRICSDWEDFGKFLADMGARPSPMHCLERINNDGNYEPSNCRWATAKEQAQNTRHDRIQLTYQGVTRSLTEWAQETGIGLTTLFYRARQGWTTERILTAPVIVPRADSCARCGQFVSTARMHICVAK